MNNVSTRRERTVQRIVAVHLVYLTLLPAVATFLLLGVFRIFIHPMLMITVGSAAVGIFIAVSVSYHRASNSPWKGIVALLDAPLWAACTLFAGGSVAMAVADDIVIEASAILLGVFGVVLSSARPSASQRRAAIAAVGIPLVGVAWVLWQYGHVTLATQPLRLVLLGAAVLQSAFVHYRLTHEDVVYRDAAPYIVLGIFAWFVAMGAGYALGSP